MEKISNIEIGLFSDYIRDRGLRQSSVQIYTAIVRRFLAMSPDVNSLTDYNNFLIKYAVKKSQYNYPYALMKFIDYYIEDVKLRSELKKGLIIRPLKDKQKDSARLTPEKINNIINNLTYDKHKLIASIQVETGVRANDIISGLTLKNIHEEKEDGKRILRLRLQSKGAKMITTYIMNEKLIDRLLFYAKKNSERIILPNEGIDDEYVFLHLSRYRCSFTGRTSFSISRNVYIKYWMDLKESLSACNIPLNDWATHDFRRNYARRLYKESGYDFELLKQALNHVRSDTTLRYIRSNPEEIRAKTRMIQERIVSELKEKKLIVIKDNYIEGLKAGDEVPDTVQYFDDNSKELISLGINEGALKYI